MANWLGNTLDYVGTALNLPELGLSEKLGGGQTQYTGSTPATRQQESVMQSTPQGYPVGPGQYQGGGAFGATYTGPTGSINNSDVSSGQVAGDSTGVPYQTTPTDPGMPDFQSVIQPALDALSGAEGLAQNQYQTNVGEAQHTADTATAKQNAYMTGEQQTADTQLKGHQTQTADALNQSRRSFSEINQGIQSKYGGTTGTGKFSSEIVGRMTMENIQKIRSGLQTATTEIENRMSQVRTLGQIALDDIATKADDQKKQLKDSLDQMLQNIRMKKGELLASKANMVNDALKSYQDSVRQVETNNQAFKQQIYLKQLDAENTLKTAQAKMNDISKGFKFDVLQPEILRMDTIYPGAKKTIKTVGANSSGAPLYSAEWTQGTETDDDKPAPGME